MVSRVYNGTMAFGLNRTNSFRGEETKDLSLSHGVRVSERFQSIERTIYGIGFTCVVVMGVNRDTQEVRLIYFTHIILFIVEGCYQGYNEV